MKIHFMLKGSVIAMAALLFFGACKKQTAMGDAEPAIAGTIKQELDRKKTEDRVLAWLDRKKTGGSVENNRKIDLLKSKLDFSALRLEALGKDRQIIVVPLAEGLTTLFKKDESKLNLLLLKADESGNIRNGNIVQYDGADKGGSRQVEPATLMKNLYGGGDNSKNSRFLFLNITGRPVRELEFKEGKLHAYRALQTKEQLANSGQRPPPAPISPAPACVDWYWVTTYYYADGHTETETTFAFSVCEPSSGGGSEGEAEQEEEDCSAIEDELNGSPASENLGVSTILQTPNIRTKTYTWTCFRQAFGLWRFDSYEEGTHIRVKNEWQWKSLVHKSVGKTGWSIGGVIRFTVLSWTASVGKYWAGMELSYQFEGNAVCRGFPIEVNRTGTTKSPIWNVND